MRRAGSVAAARFPGLRGLSVDRWITRDRCAAWSGMLLAGELAVFAILAAGSYGLIVALPEPVTTDFVSFYAAGRLADAGVPALAYDQAAHHAAEAALRGAGVRYYYFFYPPVFLLLCAPLARLPYLAAFAVFQAGGFAVLLSALRRILGLRGWDRAAWQALLPFLAFPAMLVNLGFGQNAFLTAGLFAWGLLLLPARPVVAGCVLGALCFKPHFGLLLPVAFAAGGHWRAFAGAALSVCGWIALSVAAFGAAPWLAYAAALPATASVYQSGVIPFSVMVSPLGAARVLGLSAPASLIVQAIAALAAAAAVAWVWRRGGALAVRAAALLSGALLAAPLVLIYDLVLGAVAIAFLVRHARARGWLAHEKLLLGLVGLVALVARDAAAELALPLGPLAGAVLLGLCVAHARAEAGQRRSSRRPSTPSWSAKADHPRLP